MVQNVLRSLVVRPVPAHSVKLILNIALSLTAVGVTVRAAGAFKEIVFARAFGSSPETDAFVLAFTYATFLPSVLGGAMGTALIAALAHSGGALRGQGLVSLTKWTAAASFACCAVVYLLAPHALGLVFGLGGADLEIATRYARVLAPLGGTLMLSAALTALLNSEKQFYIAGVAPLVTPILIMLAIYLAAGRIGVEAAAWGTVIGGVAELAILAGRMRAQRRLYFTPATNGESDRAGWWFWRSVGVLSFADALAAMSPMVDQIFLARLESGAITHFNYASKVNSVLIGLFGTAFSVTIYPYLSDLAARRDGQALRRLAVRLAGIVLPVTAISTVLVYTYSYEIVDILFGRGRFTERDTLQVSAIQQVFCFQLVFYIALLFAMAVLNALRATYSVFYLAFIGLVTNALCDWLLYRGMGAAGIALSSVITSIVGFTCALLFIRAALRRIANAPA